MTEVAPEDASRPAHVNDWFFKETSLEDLLAEVEPVPCIEALALDDLTPAEATVFLETVNE